MPLSDDLLWSIFLRNAIDDTVKVEDRLTTTRLTSHVCTNWRRLLLESTSIWAKLVWISHGKNEQWMQEILNRAGNSSLLWVHIHWTMINDPEPTQIPPILDILFTQYWNRIENFRASIFESDKLFWRYLERPAPKLRLFDIVICNPPPGPAYVVEESTVSLPENLFSNHAPLLTNLSCPYFCVNQRTPWLSQIDTLAMSTASFEMLLDIIGSIPPLRILRIFSIHDPHHASNVQCSRLASMSRYILPRLSTILTGTIDIKTFNALWFTKSKSPAESRTFHRIDCRGLLADIEDSQFHHSIENMLYHHNFLTSNPNDMDWGLYIEDRYMHVLNIDILSSSLQLRLSLFFFNVPSNGWDLILRHLKAYTGYIRSFALNINASNTVLVDLHTSMSNVLSISVEQPVLEWYNRAQESRGPLFPALKMIHCKEGFRLDQDGYLDSLVAFLEGRQNVGWALPTVNIDEDTDMSYAFGALNRFVGLRITWISNKRRMEYICGQSEPLEWDNGRG